MRTVLLVSVLVLTGFAPAPFPTRASPSDNRKRLDGVWVVESVKWRGSPVLGTHWGNGLAFRLYDRITITRGELTFPDYAPNQPARWAIHLHRGTKDFDLVPLHVGPTRMPGFYRQEYGNLTLIYRSLGSGRPKADSDEDVAFVLLKPGKP
jgi:hypothetical protein